MFDLQVDDFPEYARFTWRTPGWRSTVEDADYLVALRAALTAYGHGVWGDRTGAYKIIYGSRPRARLVLLALMLVAATASASAEAKKCRYLRIGATPISWHGARLVINGSINNRPVPMIVDTGATNIMLPGSLVRLGPGYSTSRASAFGWAIAPNPAPITLPDTRKMQLDRTRCFGSVAGCASLDEVLQFMGSHPGNVDARRRAAAFGLVLTTRQSLPATQFLEDSRAVVDRAATANCSRPAPAGRERPVSA